MKYKKLCHKLQMIDRAWNDYADYIKTTWSADHFWQIIHCEIKPDKLRHRAKQAHMQGATMESVHWFQNVMKFIHETKTKYKDKNH